MSLLRVISFVKLISCLGVIWLLTNINTAAAERFALLIGNSDYSSVPDLQNPRNDVLALEAHLEDLGFKVTTLTDLTKSKFEDGIIGFSSQIRASEEPATALFFFAGHGISFENESYLLPVDARLSDRSQIPFVSIEANMVFDQLRRAGAEVVLVFLDACRDDPFLDVPNASRSAVTRGLAKPSSNFRNSTQGFLVAYATEPGDVADDGQGQHSPFVEALMNNIALPNTSIVDVMARVRKEVLIKTNERQRPWESSSLLEPFYMNRTAVPAADDGLVRRTVELDKEAFERIRQSQNISDFERYLGMFPDGLYRSIAREKIEDLKTARETKAAVAEFGQRPPSSDFPVSFRKSGMSLIVEDVKPSTPFSSYLFKRDMVRSINGTAVADIPSPEGFLLQQYNQRGQVVLIVQRGRSQNRVIVK
ncbi:MAG: caspase family protein [Pseudomonadota bacterium]